MKKKYTVIAHKETIEREYTYIPFRYIMAVLITLFEILAIIGIVVAFCYYIPYFYIAAWITEIFYVIKIVASDNNPDYKVPWLLFVLILPIAGFMLYFLFYSRKLQSKFMRRLNELERYGYDKNQEEILNELERENAHASTQAKMLCSISGANVFKNTKQSYYPLGEDMWQAMLSDLEKAEKFIFLEYFIIEEGVFWNSILDILKKKAANGITVRVLYDDIGCMSTLPGDYHKQLAKFRIEAVPFSRLRGQADGEFNNRNHRKILVIDGEIGYTGGVNIADEYINKTERFGHWKDSGIRLEGEAVWEMTRLFLSDYGINVKSLPKDEHEFYPTMEILENSFVIPFGDGPRPLFERGVGKSVIQNILGSATRYVYMTTPYLIIDNDLCTSIESAALRGVDIRIIVPHIPDKKIVFGMTKSFYHRLMRSGVKIYEYAPGERMQCELIKYCTCGWILLLMNLCLTIIVFFMVYWNRTFTHHTITAIAMATYTFIAFAVSIANTIKYKKYNSPIFSASKAISFASACVSMLTLTSTMLTAFSDGTLGKTEQKVFLAGIGFIVFGAISATAIYMIVAGTKKLKTLNSEVQNG